MSHDPNKTKQSRPRQHQIETEQRAKFEQMIGAIGWTYKRLDGPDYGIDGQVEIFDSGKKTGLSFYVQLRATDEQNISRAKAIRLRKEELLYYLSRTEPVMVVKYVASTNDMYWIWASQVAVLGQWSKAAKQLFGLGAEKKWTANTLAAIRSDCENDSKIQNGNLTNPIEVSVQFTAPPLNLSSAELKARLLALEELFKKVIYLDFDKPNNVIQVFFNGRLVHIATGIRRSITFNYDYSDDFNAKTVAADVITALGLAIGFAGRESAGSLLISKAAEGGQLIRVPGFGEKIILAVASSGNFELALRLLPQYSASVSDHNELSSMLRSLPGAFQVKSTDIANRALQTCKEIIKDFAQRIGNEQAGIIAYNLADGLPGNFSDQALALLDWTGELAPGYLQRDYYWRHRAMRELDVGLNENAIQSIDLACSLRLSDENLVGRIKVAVYTGDFGLAFEYMQRVESLTYDKQGHLMGLASAFLAESGIESIKVSSHEDLMDKLFDMAEKADAKGEDTKLFATALTIFSLNRQFLQGIATALEVAGDDPTLLAVVELAMEVAIEAHGKEFPALMMENYREFPETIKNALYEGFVAKVKSVATGEEIRIIRLLNEDGSYTQFEKGDSGLEWKERPEKGN